MDFDLPPPEKQRRREAVLNLESYDLSRNPCYLYLSTHCDFASSTHTRGSVGEGSSWETASMFPCPPSTFELLLLRQADAMSCHTGIKCKLPKSAGDCLSLWM